MLSNWHMNKKMRILLEDVLEYSNKEKLELNVEQLQKLFFPPFKKVKDCIIIAEESSDELERYFDNAIKMYMNKTAFEYSNTEVRMGDFFESKVSMETETQLALFAIEIWILRLKQLELNAKYCFIMSCDKERVEIRFHKVREEGIWLDENLENYKEGAIGYRLA